MEFFSTPASVVKPELVLLELTTEAKPESTSPSSPPDSYPQPDSPGQRQRQIEIFASTFLTIFLAELGDKTQLTTLLMTAESHSPWVVFAGAGAALVLTSLLGVSLGGWLAKRVSPRTLEVSAGLMLLGISIWMVWDIVGSA